MHKFCAIVLVIGAVSSGCANLEPVGKFGAAGAEIVKAYRPLVSEYLAACRERVIITALDADGPYDLRAVRISAATTCAESERQKDVVLQLATVVEGYSNALITLSAIPTDVFAADLDATISAAKALKIGGAGEVPLLPPAQADAVTKLLKIIAEVIVSRKTDAAAQRAIQDGNAPFETLVLSMKGFVNLLLKEELKRVARAADRRLNDFLIPRSEARRVPGNSEGTSAAVDRALPFRTAQPTYLAIRENASQRLIAVQRFDEAADELISTSDNLAKNYDKLTAVGRADAVKRLLSKVKILRESLNAF